MKVSVIGLGYVGSVAAAGLATAGHEVIGIDIDRQRVEAYQRGVLPIHEPQLPELVRDALKLGRLRFILAEDVNERLGDAVIIATGTPPAESGAANLSQVWSAVSWVRERQPLDGVVIMKSTVPPGTGVRVQRMLLRGTGLSYLSNPEFLREGQAVSDWFHPDRIVVGGADKRAIEVAKKLYDGMPAPLVVTDVTSAEMIKYAANAFLATKVSFINEIAALCDRVGATIDDVVSGIALDPRIGPSYLRAGVGYGGSCFPKDVRALDHLALENGHSFELLRAVIAVNSRQCLLPLYALRERFGRLAGLRAGILGLAFKPHTDDVRESPSTELIRQLLQEGVDVRAYDPMAMPRASRVLPAEVQFMDCPLACAEGAQALILMTEWPQIVESDWEEIAKQMRPPRLLFDGRNALDAARMLQMGFDYRGVGRRAAAVADSSRMLAPDAAVAGD
jgi:UDPglucose 6-dehydrogenase